VQFLAQGKITRLDLAIDFPGFTARDVIVAATHTRKTGCYSDQYGNPETIYIGAVKSKNRVVAYTKKFNGELGLRLECRVKPKCLGESLALIQNPFDRVRLYPTTALDKKCGAIPSEIVADSMRLRGIKRTLALLPKPITVELETALLSAENMLPKAATIWKDWPAQLAKLGL
jgi:hypothetical protein